MNKSKAGRPRFSEQLRRDRKVTMTDEVFNGLKKLGNGSASQAIDDLYKQANGKVHESKLTAR